MFWFILCNNSHNCWQCLSLHGLPKLSNAQSSAPCCPSIQRELGMHSTVPCKHFNFSWIFILLESTFRLVLYFGGNDYFAWLHHFPVAFRSPVIYCSEIKLTQSTKYCIPRWSGQAVVYARTGRRLRQRDVTACVVLWKVKRSPSTYGWDIIFTHYTHYKIHSEIIICLSYMIKYLKQL